ARRRSHHQPERLQPSGDARVARRRDHPSGHRQPVPPRPSTLIGQRCSRSALFFTSGDIMANDTTNRPTTGTSANRDPLTGAPGAHPIGTAAGAVAGGVATGAAVGSVAGPVGTAVGAAVGAVVGGLAGK